MTRAAAAAAVAKIYHYGYICFGGKHKNNSTCTWYSVGLLMPRLSIFYSAEISSHTFYREVWNWLTHENA